MSLDLDIHRIDFLQVQPMARNTLVVLPLAKKKQQKVAIGDDSGVITVFYLKRGETQIEWRSQNLGREITKLVLQHGRDKLFVACGQSLQGFTRKGKEFLKIKTNLTETIHQLFADDTTIWTGGEYVLNLYENCRDSGFVMCPDRIRDLVCAPIAPDVPLSSILAFQDKSIRVYAGERLFFENFLSAPVTCLGFYDKAELEARNQGSQKEVFTLFGTEAGTVGMLSMDQSGAREVFSLNQSNYSNTHTGGVSTIIANSNNGGKEGGNKRRAGVTHVCTADIGRSGVLDLCLTRDDGAIEIWNVDNSPYQMASTPPRLMYETSLGECVRALDVGTVALGEYKDLVISTFSGKVLAFTADPAARDATGSQMVDLCPEGGANPAAASIKRQELDAIAPDANTAATKDKRFRQLKSEVAKLRQEVNKEKARYEKDVSKEGIAVSGDYNKVSHTFKLRPEEACYVLTIECQSSLASVAIRSDIPLDLLDTNDGTDVIKSYSTEENDAALVTYRFQELTKRFVINMRTVEGEPGNISCFVVPQSVPKVAHLITMNIKPLSLHEKVSEIDEKCPFNELRLSGQFSLMDMHCWLGLCVPEVPARPANHESITYYYKSTFLGTQLHCQYAKGSAKFRSDDIATISVVRDTMSREATARKIQLSINVDVKDESFPYVLSLIHPKLAFQQMLTKQVKFVEPLSEIQLQEGKELEYLDPELLEILNNSSKIQKQFELQPQRLNFLHSLITRLYTHIWRLRGHQIVPPKRLQDLKTILDGYNLSVLQSFFEEPMN